MEVTILSTSNTRASKGKALRMIQEMNAECLFLDLPRNSEDIVRQIPVIGREEALRRMREYGIIEDPYDTQDCRAMEPIFDELSSLGMNVYCFGDPSRHAISRSIISKIVALTLRAKLGRIDVEEWRNAMVDEILSSKHSSWREAEYILERAENSNVCVDAGDDVENNLREMGAEVRRIVVDRVLKPLDILRELFHREFVHGDEVPDEKVTQLVRTHVEFVDLVILHGYERALELWRRRCQP